MRAYDIMVRLAPVLAINLFMIGMVALLFFLDEEGAFAKFTHFGPTADTKFLNMKLDTWPKVILVYATSFISAYLGSFYYTNIQSGFLGSAVTNPSVKELDMTRTEATYVVWMSAISYWLLQILQFMITLTMQLQFMVFVLLGNLTTNIPFYMSHLNDKKFKK